MVKAKIATIRTNPPSIATIRLLLDGFSMTAKITEESRVDLGINEGDYVFAMFKASSPQVVREEY